MVGGRDPSFSLSTAESKLGLLCLDLSCPVQERHGHILEGVQRKVMQMRRGLKRLSCGERRKNLELFSREKIWEDFHQCREISKWRVQKGQNQAFFSGALV